MDPQVAPDPPPQGPCCYSQYLTILGQGVRPPDDLADSVIEQLTEAVRHRIRSTYWHVSPRCFGFEQAEWTDHFSSGNYPPEVVGAYYLYVFGNESNFADLLGRVEAGLPIGALVGHVLIRQFLWRRQNENDPIGYAVYANVCGAVDALVTAHRLQAERLPPRNDTPVRFPDRTDPVADPPAIERALREDTGWAPLLPRLGRRSIPAQRGLQLRFTTFRIYGVGAFTVRVVNTCLQEPVRAAVNRWYNLPVEYDPKSEKYLLFRTAVPDWSPDGSADLQARCLTQLQRLRAQGGIASGNLLNLLDELIRLLTSGSPIPSRAELGRCIGVNREMARTLFNELVRRLSALPDED